jgi:hypothetical protein
MAAELAAGSFEKFRLTQKLAGRQPLIKALHLLQAGNRRRFYPDYRPACLNNRQRG